MDEKAPRFLDRLFSRTQARTSGDCPLPEPGRGVDGIDEPGLLSIRRQPADYDYDTTTNLGEAERFNQELERMVRDGEISASEARRLRE